MNDYIIGRSIVNKEFQEAQKLRRLREFVKKTIPVRRLAHADIFLFSHKITRLLIKTKTVPDA